MKRRKGDQVKFDLRDKLIIESRGSLSGVILAVLVSFEDADGEIQTTKHRHAPSGDLSLEVDRFNVGKGDLISVSVYPESGAPRVGQVFIRLFLSRLGGSNNDIRFPLYSGYVDIATLSGWPVGGFNNPLFGRGNLRALNISDPSVGSEVVVTVPVNSAWRVIGMNTKLTTSAVGGNRTPRFIVKNGSVRVMLIENGSMMFQSQSSEFSFLKTVIALPAGSLPLSGLVLDEPLLAGFTFGTLTTSLDTGDQYSSTSIYIEEFVRP